MKTSDSVSKIYPAFAAAQGAFKPAFKDSENPFFKTSYADFGSVVEAVREPLNKNGLAFIQMPSLENDKLVLVTRIIHSSGEWFESSMPIRTTKDDAQALGAAITYARRQALQAALGVATSDDDAESTMDRGAQGSRPPDKLSKDQIKTLLDNLSKLAVSQSQVSGFLGMDDLYSMGVEDFKLLNRVGASIKNGAKVSEYFK